MAHIFEWHLEERRLRFGSVLKVHDVHALWPIGQVFRDDPRNHNLGVGEAIRVNWCGEHLPRNIWLNLELADLHRSLESNASIFREWQRLCKVFASAEVSVDG